MAKGIINEEFLQQVETLQTLLQNNISGLFGGNRQSKTYGSSCEFADYIDYIPGDDITKIDWNAYARFEKLYQKLYLDERQMHTRIYIDVSRSMAHGKSKNFLSPPPTPAIFQRPLPSFPRGSRAVPPRSFTRRPIRKAP